MKTTYVILLLQVLMIIHCIAEESTDMSSADPDLDMHEVQEPPKAGNLQNMWAAVRQSLGGLGSSIKPASTDNEIQPAKAENSSKNQTIALEDTSPDEDSGETKTSVVKEDNENDVNDEDLPSQLVPIEKGLVYLRPKEDERWVLNEEGMVTWGISSYIQPNADKIYMNGNLYLGDKMIMSVFKGVPLSIGSESWTPPTFLKPSPDYRLRLWSQPSIVGIIDQYSPTFSIVPRKEDAFMFSYNRSVVFEGNGNNKTTPPPPTAVVNIPTDKIRVGQNNLPAPSVSEKHPMVIDVNSTPSTINPNLPTGIYALYPSNAAPQYQQMMGLVISLSAISFFVV